MARAVGWTVLAFVGPFIGMVVLRNVLVGPPVGAIVLGTVPGVFLGLRLGRNRAWATLAVTVAVGIAVLPAGGCAIGLGGLDNTAVWMRGLAAAGAVLYVLPLVAATGAAVWLAGRRRRLGVSGRP
ncbi:hypothetical protein [Kitasatospora sp. CB01950]|uniref:hypothetical protein n=1 Tax=Kitasatospora sp. CB01950 TaxID=1703930 RepID=UPI00093E0AAF|nr:hypothetical protein [Kitasatospora sp. CB01950]OKJ13603.1 hypothetical protein AMK19_09090 [Kitasatospora sp. CB01950]